MNSLGSWVSIGALASVFAAGAGTANAVFYFNAVLAGNPITYHRLGEALGPTAANSAGVLQDGVSNDASIVSATGALSAARVPEHCNSCFDTTALFPELNSLAMAAGFAGLLAMGARRRHRGSSAFTTTAMPFAGCVFMIHRFADEFLQDFSLMRGTAPMMTPASRIFCLFLALNAGLAAAQETGETRVNIQQDDLKVSGERPLGSNEKIPPSPGRENFGVRPPIEIRFRLPAPGYVTLVIDDAEGKRVRNLIAETHFPAGENMVYWDGLDETAISIRQHGVHDVIGRLVEPGTYTVRGIRRDQIELRYEFSAYTAGDPPWSDGQGRGRWMADHTPPTGVLFLPAGRPPQHGQIVDGHYRPGGDAEFIPNDRGLMLLCSKIRESGDGLIWTDLEGKKIRGATTLGAGGGWCGADWLARDEGQAAAPEVYAYAATGWSTLLDVRALPSCAEVYGEQNRPSEHAPLQGFAVRDQVLYLSLTTENLIKVVDAQSRAVLASIKCDAPRGLAFDRQGRLLAASKQVVLRYEISRTPQAFNVALPTILIAQHLEDPYQLAVTDDRRILVGDRGRAQQVKIFTPAGELLRTIGAPGGSKLGPYDPTTMNSPAGLALAPDGRLWVAEESNHPKRISVWTLDGQLVKAMYGPPSYGSGGRLGVDKQSFFLAQFQVGLGFQVDWQTGEDRLTTIYYKPEAPCLIEGLKDGAWHTAPERDVRIDGRTYLVSDAAGMWRLEKGVALPVAAVGQATNWQILERPEYQARLPVGAPLHEVLFAWSDLNDDHLPQPDEVQAKHLPDLPATANGKQVGGLTIGGDLAVTTSSAWRLPPRGYTPGGAPTFHLDDLQLLAPKLHYAWYPFPTYHTPANWTIAYAEPLRGYREGRLRWTYMNRWPEMHAFFREQPQRVEVGGLIDNVIGTLGPPVTPNAGDGGEILGFASYNGRIYLLNSAGYFIASLFQDYRDLGYFNSFAKLPEARRDMPVNEASIQGEALFNTMTETADGKIYLRTFKSQGTVIRVDGLESIRQLPEVEVTVSTEQLLQCEQFFRKRELARSQRNPTKPVTVVCAQEAPIVDGNLAEWEGAPRIRSEDPFIRNMNVPSNLSIQDYLDVAARTHGAQLYLALSGSQWSTPMNSAGSDDWQAWLTEGGALDLLVQSPSGLKRLLVSRLESGPRAYLISAVENPAAANHLVKSAWRQLPVLVQNVSEQVQIVGQNGAWELAVPWTLFGFTEPPAAGQTVRADFGVLWRTLDFEGRPIAHQVYVHNKGASQRLDLVGQTLRSPETLSDWKVGAP